MSERERTPEEAAQELVDAWVWWKEDTEIGNADPSIARALLAKATTPAATPAHAAAPCPECGSTSPRELSIGKRLSRGAADPLRLQLHDVNVVVLEACPDCGEQTRSTDADEFLAKLCQR